MDDSVKKPTKIKKIGIKRKLKVNKKINIDNSIENNIIHTKKRKIQPAGKHEKTKIKSKKNVKHTIQKSKKNINNITSISKKNHKPKENLVLTNITKKPRSEKNPLDTPESSSDSDEDFKQIKNKQFNKRNKNSEVIKERNSRTLFVGNVITTVKKTQLLKLFGKYGKIESIRLRCATPVRPGISKRLAVIKKLLHPKRATLHSYITFVERENALKALELNGTKYKGHYLRIQICNDTAKPDPAKAIFIGNLPFEVEDNDLWEALEPFGAISSVRVVRNAATGAGIGIGFVNFQSTDSVELVLMNNDIKIKNKEVRIKRYAEPKTKNRKKNDNRQPKEESPSKKPKIKNPAFKRPGRKFGPKNKITFSIKNSVFQGSTSTQHKKKFKLNKGLIQKIKMSQKIAPKPAK